MSDVKLNTVEEITGFIGDVTKEIIGTSLDELKKENQEAIAAIRRELDAEKIKADVEGKGLKAARFLRTYAAANGNQEKAIEIAHNMNDVGTMKAMEATDASAGGVWVPEELSSEVIELLRPASCIRRMGPRTIQMPTGSMSMTKITGGATSEYIGESQDVPKTEQSTGKISLNWKKLACVLPISNDLLKFETFAGEEMIRDDAVAGLAQRADLAFLSDPGTEHTPKGLYYLTPAANKLTANATVNLANVTYDVARMMLQMQNANANMINCGWLWAPTTEMFFRFLRDGNGNYVFKDEMDMGTFNGYPFCKTTKIPYTLGSGSNESLVYFVDFADVLIGEASTLEVEASREASYMDGGSLKSAYSLDQTVLRLIEHHDIACRHEESLVIMEDTKWNPTA